ncbi:hypothetical protein Pint_01209 [Pistacia integerrima]|uniref:Uncharacterized protein n=1 Tax=Pistacia integerrima TaxID=434235 RepID=A0ACC0ZN02_9ROSI|nr:hypothetical protein Pint_01209 [Pistacia integerrima]
MKVKKKGVIYSSSSPSSYKDPHTVLKLLPLTILALASTLPAQDQEVIAYMITRSIATPKNPSSEKNKCKRKPSQKNPLFECGCFGCYTSYWYRWDSSPNRDLIHQVIEAFEDHLVHKESPKKQNKGKKKDKLFLDRFESNISFTVPKKELGNTEISMPDTKSRYAEEHNKEHCAEEEESMVGAVNGNMEMKVVTVQVVQVPVSSHKGLARKVLPDVVGLLNSRLWNLWSSASI